MHKPGVVSKVLISDSSNKAITRLAPFVEKMGLVPLIAKGNLLKVLDANQDLGAVFVEYKSFQEYNELADSLFQLRRELPVFARYNDQSSREFLQNLSSQRFASIYDLDNIAGLESIIKKQIFNRSYPEEMIASIKTTTLDALDKNLADCNIICEPPYLVKDRIFLGDLYTLIPITTQWCGGFIMLQVDSGDLLYRRAMSDRNLHRKDDINFRDVSDILSEITNVIWGRFKARFSNPDMLKEGLCTFQVPLVANHQQGHICFGSDEPHLCFKYVISDVLNHYPDMVLYQKFIFNMYWLPEMFEAIDSSTEDSKNAGKLELF